MRAWVVVVAKHGAGETVYLIEFHDSETGE